MGGFACIRAAGGKYGRLCLAVNPMARRCRSIQNSFFT